MQGSQSYHMGADMHCPTRTFRNILIHTSQKLPPNTTSRLSPSGAEPVLVTWRDEVRLYVEGNGTLRGGRVLSFRVVCSCQGSAGSMLLSILLSFLGGDSGEFCRETWACWRSGTGLRGHGVLGLEAALPGLGAPSS